MKLGVFTTVLSDRSPEEAFRFLHERGVECVEIGVGGFPGDAHLKPAEMLADEARLDAFRGLLSRYELEISALSVHSNHVHPDPAKREQAARDYTAALQLAEKLGVTCVVTFSGCPGDHPGAKYPNWVTYTWPEDFKAILDYQWNEVLIPFWKEAVKEADSHGIKIAFEMHPGMCVFNPSSLLRLRGAVSETLGVNFDPSHLFWQGIRPAEAIRALKGAIYHFHAKDTKMDAALTAVNGVLDIGSLDDLAARPWLFRTVGFGNDALEWKEIISALRLTGYDGAISLEHEDALMSIEEGVTKAIDFMKPLLIREKALEVFWA